MAKMKLVSGSIPASLMFAFVLSVVRIIHDAAIHPRHTIRAYNWYSLSIRHVRRASHTSYEAGESR